jgi:cellulase (glycosyl hydrolase family 5)/List-Bact-rpt repeat protein
MNARQARVALSCAFVLWAVTSLFVVPSEASFTNFITRSGDQLMDGSQVFRFISFNDDNILKTWGNVPAHPFEQEDAIRTVAQMGGQVLRAYTLSVGPSNAHVTGPNTFSEEYFRSLDKLVQLGNQYGVRVIIVLVDNFNYHVGGIGDYAAFRGLPASAFFTDPQVRQDFKNTISHVVNRVNHYTGVAYKDDKAILAWETGNELNPPDEWTSDIAAYIKSVDPNHLVIDGRYGISPASLADANVDIVSNHYYPDSDDHNPDPNEDFAARCTNDRDTSRGYKPLVVGEFGEFGNQTLSSWSNAVNALLSTVVSNGTSGAMVWALRHHHKTGGFYFHPDTLVNYRWPGFPSGNGWQETEKLNTIRNYAFGIRDLGVPPREVPPPPVLLPVTSASSISWRGSAGAETYDIERATSESDPWTIVGTDVSDSYNPFQPFNDTSAVSGQAYFYRVKAKNVAGVSPPSNVSVTGFPQIVDEMNDFTKTSTYTSQLTLDGSNASFFNADTSRLTRTTATVQFVVYQTPDDLVSFLVDTYFWPYEPTVHFKFYTSADGAGYTELSPLVDEVGGDWIRIQYRPPSVPTGARFLKIEFRNTSDNNWTPQISRLTIDYRGTPPGGPLAPTVTMTAASNITTTAATLNGLANPNGSPTNAIMQWGTTTAYGNTTPAQSLGSGTTNVPVSADIGGLTPNTTYHYRIVASNGVGTTNGADSTFNTLQVQVPSGSGTLTVAVHGGGTVTTGDGRINCPTTCSATYTAGTSVTLTAVPKSGRSFGQWGEACGGTATTCALTLNSDQSVTATFSGAPFTDGSGPNSEITGASTVIKAVHVIELRAAIDDVRAANGLGAFNWTDPTLAATSTSVRRDHFLELRTALGAVCAIMTGKCTAYTDATLTPTQTVIKAVHLNELRANVRALE